MTDDCPTCPAPDTEEHYRLYVAATGRLLMVDVPADTIIDSVTLNSNPMMMTLNSDYSKVIMPMWNDEKTYVYDAFSLELDTTLDYWGDFHFDRQRNIGLFISAVGGLIQLDGATLEETGALPDLWMNVGQIDTANGVFYSTPMESGRKDLLYRIDYITMTVIDSVRLIDMYGNPLVPTRLLPLSGNDRLYMTVFPSTVFIYDLSGDSALYWASTGVARFPRCDLLYDHLRERVYFGEPGQEFMDISPAEGLFVFDVTGDSLEMMFPTRVAVSGTTLDAPILYLRMTPDQRYLYAAPEWNYPILRYDLDKGIYDNTLHWDLDPVYPFYPYGIEIGANLN